MISDVFFIQGGRRALWRALAVVVVLCSAPRAGRADLVGGSALSHLITGGDMLHISIAESPDLERDCAVAADGSISLPLLGRVTVGKVTCAEAARIIKAAYEKEYFKTATVKLSVSQFVSGAIIIQGAVRQPGPLEVSGDQLLTLMEALARCGGVNEDAAADQVKVLRWAAGSGFQRETIVVNVAEMLEKGDLRNDLFLAPRDMVVVPRMGSNGGGGEFLALGELGSPGFHPAREKLDVIRAITGAGGLTRESQMDAARLLRPERGGNYKVIPLDLQRLFVLADMKVNLPVLPGDILFVPSAAHASGGQAVFLGEVNRTGTVPLPLDQQSTLARTILTLGGFTKFAREGAVKVMRTAPDGTKQTLIIDAGAILKTGDFEHDLPLRDGDVVIVPERTVF